MSDTLQLTMQVCDVTVVRVESDDQDKSSSYLMKGSNEVDILKLVIVIW